jgi:hypothetical protein
MSCIKALQTPPLVCGKFEKFLHCYTFKKALPFLYTVNLQCPLPLKNGMTADMIRIMSAGLKWFSVKLKSLRFCSALSLALHWPFLMPVQPGRWNFWQYRPVLE